MATTRRNGQLWSCEPCRKSKLRCDHASPVCGRCIRRDRQHLCVYHPSPLTRLTRATTALDNPLSLSPRVTKTRENGVPPIRRSINAREEPRGKSTPVPPPTESTELSTILDDWCQKKPTVQTPGFLGHTSYSDAFRDSDSGLELGSLSPSPETFAMNIENVQRGSRVLILLKHLPLYREMLVARYKVWSGWTIGRPITLMILSQTEEMWNSVQCDEADETKQTLLLSKRLFEKQTQPINLHSETTWIEFVSSVTGRWETLGLLFTLIGLAADSTPRDSDDKYHELDGLEGIGQTAVKVGDLCLQFCENAGIVNDIVCSLLLHHVCLLTAVYGDGSHRAWRKLGDLATTLFAFGLHQESVNLPFFLEEIRHRTMIAAYAVDKSGATFLGRPPLISRQYCDLPMPLDLSWDEVLAEPAAREAAIANLTVDGWNKEGSFQNGAMGRICLLASIFREKALELSLGRVTEDLPTRVEALSQELHQQYEDLPDYLHWDFIGHSSDDRLRIDIRLEYIYIDFLLYRNLFKRMKISPDRIVSVSLEIMTVLLSLVARTLEIPTARRNVSWNLCNAGLPSAGVLSAELLRQSRLRIPESSVFSRSEIIQKLSIFASYLETMVQHDDGNHRIAQQGQRAIRHVLDQILSAPIQAVPSMYDSTIGLEIGESGPVLMNSDLLEGIDVDDRGPFLEWLEGTTDFNEPWLAWMNLS